MSGMAHMFMIGGAIARHLLLDRGDIYSGYLNLLAVRAALEPNFKKRRSILVTSLAWILSEESILSYGASIGAPSIASTESNELLQKQQDIRRAIDEAETKKQVEACVSTWLGNDHLM